MENYKKILNELDHFLKIDYENLTYKGLGEVSAEISILDQKLPNLDDLELPESKFQLSEVEKAKQALTEEILAKRSSFTPM